MSDGPVEADGKWQSSTVRLQVTSTLVLCHLSKVSTVESSYQRPSEIFIECLHLKNSKLENSRYLKSKKLTFPNFFFYLYMIACPPVCWKVDGKQCWPDECFTSRWTVDKTQINLQTFYCFWLFLDKDQNPSLNTKSQWGSSLPHSPALCT